MKKMIFLVMSLFGSMSLAETREYSDVYKCMQALQPVTKESVCEVPGRTSIVAMFKEGFNGMYAREGESKASEGVISSGALLIEKRGLYVCPLDWSPYNPESIVFNIKDSAGKLKLRFEYGKKNASGQIEAFEQPSYFTSVSESARGRTCQPISDADKTRGHALLKKMILSALRKDIAAKGNKDYQAPAVCKNKVVGITSKEIEDLTQPTRAPAVLPSDETTAEL